MPGGCGDVIQRIKNIYKGGGREKIEDSPRFELKIAGVQVRSGSHCTYQTNENALKFTSPSIYFHRWARLLQESLRYCVN